MSAGGSSFPAAPVLSCGPRPVELHGVCVGRGASQRLALAVKLARRDLQRTLLARGVAQFTVQSPPEVKNIPQLIHQLNISYVLRARGIRDFMNPRASAFVVSRGHYADGPRVNEIPYFPSIRSA